MIIIGILAAIAIPIFLRQRTSAQDAACLSDRRNGAVAATAYVAANGGSFTGLAPGTLISTYGWNTSDSVSGHTAEATEDGADFEITAEPASGAGCTFAGGEASMDAAA